MELTVQNVYGLLLRSRLLSLEEARTAFARWQEEARERANDAPAFLRWLVAARLVTDYQAGLLGGGYAEGFFIHQYRILDRLGKGRMAGVYKAQHTTGPVVAIKVLPPSRARDATLMQRFHREARLAMKLKHPNVVRTFQLGEADQNNVKLHYLVMEYLEGETLDELIHRRRQLPPNEAVPLVYQALLGLQHVHAQGLVHRDLKPSNLMLVQTAGGNPSGAPLGVVKILDLGLGRALFDENAPAGAEEGGLTGEGMLLGTPDYMAPEQARDPRQVDIRADIYSLGCALYHLLAGQPPFPDTNIISQMVRHATEEARPLKEFNAAVPDGLQQIVSWMMAKEPAKRYPTPERAAQALQFYLGTEGDEMGSEPDDPAMTDYLTWLELGNPEAPATVPAAAPVEKKAPPEKPPRPSQEVKAVKPSPLKPAKPKAPVPVAKAASPAPPTKEPSARMKAITAESPPPQPVPDPLADKNKPKKGKIEKAAAAPVGKPAGAPSGAYDVELVALPPPGGEPPLFSFPLQRRDFVMFGIGVGTAFLGLGLGWGVARLLSRTPPPEEPPASE